MIEVRPHEKMKVLEKKKSAGGLKTVIIIIIIEASVVLGRFKSLEMVLLDYNFIVKVYREFLGLHHLVFVLTCNMNCWTLYIYPDVSS